MSIAKGDITNVLAPELGITSTSVVLLWDDSFAPDYTKDYAGETAKTYHIYCDGKKIGSTKKQTFPVYRLSPSTTYQFSINEKEVAGSGTENFITVTTRKAGKIFNVKDFGAVGDGKQIDTKAIQKTIDQCVPGGTVLIPPGTYLVDHLDLKSDLVFEIEEGAILKFIGYKEGGNYPTSEVLLPGVKGEMEYRRMTLIRACDVRNVTITGKGLIDGNGEKWWPYRNETPRPFLLEIIKSSNILVQGVTFQDPPAWNNHLLYVDNALYSDVRFLKVSPEHGVNGDGLDPNASRNVLIAGCLFGNQDDAIAIKSGTADKDGNRYRSSENITIRECEFYGSLEEGSASLGVAIGSETSGGVRHVVLKNCTFRDASSVINIKTNRERPYAIVEDVIVENITYTNAKHSARWFNKAPISLDQFYVRDNPPNPSAPEPRTPETPIFRNIHFKNISIHNSKGWGIYMSGFAEAPIRNVTFDKVSVKSRDGIMVQNVDHVLLKGIASEILQVE
ncbi:MAG: glycoside hydrolase family 28 protein [Paludibacter sp.]|nr:MAG: glycoside hydrolase family 28 protein [Paludibacter sp.]